jgi:hypothetical protein
MITPAISLAQIDDATGGRIGTFDIACPLCGPFKRSPRNQRRPVLRVYRIEPSFAGFYCARCGEKGAALDRNGAPPDPIGLAKARAEAAEHERLLKAKRLRTARWLWRRSYPVIGSKGEVYLRDARGYDGPLRATLRFLPARSEYLPAMIASFGFAHEVEPGILDITNEAVTGIHLTRLLPDGSGKAVFDDPDEQAKIMIGRSIGSPIVLAPMNDGLALGISEGIEDGLSIHQSLGIGVWVAGAASRMPALAEIVPAYTEVVPIFAHDDHDGQRHSAELSRRLRARMIVTEIITLGSQKEAA